MTARDEDADTAARFAMLEHRLGLLEDAALDQPNGANDTSPAAPGATPDAADNDPQLVWPPATISAVSALGWGDSADPEAWGALVAWVDWFYVTYDLREHVPVCWPDHPGLVEELASLWMAWCSAAATSRAELGDALAYWHDRYLAGFTSRWHLYQIHNCTDGHVTRYKKPPATNTALISVRETAISLTDVTTDADSTDEG